MLLLLRWWELPVCAFYQTRGIHKSLWFLLSAAPVNTESLVADFLSRVKQTKRAKRLSGKTVALRAETGFFVEEKSPSSSAAAAASIVAGSIPLQIAF